MADQEPQFLILSASDVTVALDASTGSELWRTEVQLRWMAVAGERLYGLANSKQLVSLRRADGVRPWVFEEPLRTRGDEDEPLFLAMTDAVYCVTKSNDVVAVRATDGEVLWRHSETAWAWDGLIGEGDGMLVLQAREQGVSVWSYKPADCMTCALAAADGAERWRYEWHGMPADSDAPLVPALFDETSVHCRVGDDAVVALARAYGAVRWQFPLSSQVDRLALVAPGMPGIATNGQVFAVSAADGAVRWHYRDSRDGIYIEHGSVQRAILPVTDLVRDGDLLLVAINYDRTDGDSADPNRAGVLVALAPDDGTLLWRINAKQGARPLPAPGSSVIGFVPTDPYHAYIGALAADDGRELWRRQTGTDRDEIRGWRLDDTLYAVVDNALTALAPADGAVRWSYPLASLDATLKPPYYFELSAVLG